MSSNAKYNDIIYNKDNYLEYVYNLKKNIITYFFVNL